MMMLYLVFSIRYLHRQILPSTSFGIPILSSCHSSSCNKTSNLHHPYNPHLSSSIQLMEKLESKAPQLFPVIYFAYDLALWKTGSAW